jgi:acyl carrier protein
VDASEIYPTLTDIFRDVFDQDDITLSPETIAADVDGWDSLAHVRLMVSVECAFKVRFSAADMANLKNVGELAGLILRKSR